MNYLIIEALHRYHSYLGDDYMIECPTGSGIRMTLKQVAINLGKRLGRIFQQDDNGHRPVYCNVETFQTNPHWQNLLTFNEYFNGDNGGGLGASHQTGWTGLIAELIHQCSESSPSE